MSHLYICALGALLVSTAACTMDIAEPVGEDDIYAAEGFTDGATIRARRPAAGSPTVEKPNPDVPAIPPPCVGNVRVPFQGELFGEEPSVYARIEDRCSGAIVAMNLHFAEYDSHSGPIYGIFELGKSVGELSGEWKDGDAGYIHLYVEGAADGWRVNLAGTMERHEKQPLNFRGQLQLTQ